MADYINNGDFCFPSTFPHMNKENILHQSSVNTPDFKMDSYTCFPADFPYEFSSCSNSEDLSSPIDSVVSSSNETETESDDDDMFDAMNREFARSSIHETKKFVDSTKFYAPGKLEKTWAMFGSPQSTLIGTGNWSNRTAMASNVSSKGPQVLSSLKTPLYTEKECLDFFYAAAARKMARSRMYSQGHPPIDASLKPLKDAPQPITNHSTLLHSNESLFTHDFAQRQQLLHMMKQNLMNQSSKMSTSREAMIFQQQRLIHEQHQMQNRERSFGGLQGVRCGVQPLGMHEAAWPPLKTQNQNTDQQKYNSSGTRAALLGGSIGGVKKECSGTGVFLPRQYNNHTQSHKKPGCSAALLPPRVRALNLNVVDMTSKPQSHFHGGFSSNYEALIAMRNPILMQKPRSFNPEAAAALSHEVSLPQEWTY